MDNAPLVIGLALALITIIGLLFNDLT